MSAVTKPVVTGLKAFSRYQGSLTACFKSLHTFRLLQPRNSRFMVLYCKYADTYYTRKHEYIVMETESIGRIGLSNYAQEKLGDVVYVQLPDLDKEVEKEEEVAAVESVKAASEVYSPVSGTIVAVNDALESDCTLVNKSAMDEGWIFKLSVAKPEELKSLLNEADYEKFLEAEEEEEEEKKKEEMEN